MRHAQHVSRVTCGGSRKIFDAMAERNFNQPIVGVGVMIMKDGKVLLGLRRGAHGAGEYAFPGGHLELGESYAACASREIEEECGVQVKNLRFQFTSNSMRFAPRHYIHIGMIADWAAGEPVNREPNKCGGWIWCDPNAPPQPLFIFAAQAFESLKSGQVCIDQDGLWAFLGEC
ncbi:hypothetical protein A3C96_02145 [Candidatus Uhrbacteria bacterium RIFCSPHIGHO2_02_FULL_60_10]|uniref:Nudix hydrolase domain-containing protein n=1 Tax=Candidatus Uhrbacteria bacterium RIFCSPHIGHO2_02_FULL_60_10 TaxID=1802392 RepID=A0A1F7U5U7_9BACT|nr:MAG: hypothetical protein A3C96_02145 [Candidatus Uhrbacteria bacterium RIFCSPHIGHO2_02_FULL_60_10]